MRHVNPYRHSAPPAKYWGTMSPRPLLIDAYAHYLVHISGAIW